MYKLFLSGNARSGKDTFCNLVSERLSELGFLCRRVSFADQLKNELYEFCMENLKISPFTENSDDKNIIRPILISYGMAKRKQTNGRYWLDKVEKTISELEKFNLIDVVIVTDVRFNESGNDEASFAKENGDLVYIERVDDDGNLIQPASHEEKIFNPQIEAKADYVVTWGKDVDSKLLVDEFINSVILLKLPKEQ